MIYTAITGSYDMPREDIKVFTSGFPGMSDRLASKFYKTCPHLWFAEATVWVDGNIFAKESESRIMELLNGADLALFKHPFRSTLREECCEVASRGFDTTELQKDFADMMDKDSLCECGILIRRNTPDVRRFDRVWWSLICRYSLRDQVTFPIAASIVPELKIRVLRDNLREHPLFLHKPR